MDTTKTAASNATNGKQKFLQITKENALNAYSKGCNDVKSLLSNLFGAKTFVPEKMADRINDFNDILKISGANANDYKLRPGETEDELAYRQGKLIALVYNDGEILDASNKDQYKYYPWHKIVEDASKPSGFGLSYYCYVGWYSDSAVGVRLCFIREQDAIDAGKKFIEIYEKLKVR